MPAASGVPAPSRSGVAWRWAGAVATLLAAIALSVGTDRGGIGREPGTGVATGRPPEAGRDAMPASTTRGKRPPVLALGATTAVRRARERAHEVGRTPPVAAPRGSERSSQPAADSRLDAELRILHTEAERRLAALGSGAAGHPLGAGRAGDEAVREDDDARRAAAADAFLVDHWVQEAFRGTEYPIGYPAEEREYAAALARVRSLDAVQRRDQLEVALASAPVERSGPRFGSIRWEAAPAAAPQIPPRS